MFRKKTAYGLRSSDWSSDVCSSDLSLYISPAGSGEKSGSDINNAASIGSLNTMIGRAGPGGEVLLLADQGDYTVTGILGITRGGGEGQPVVVRGIDSAGTTMGAHFDRKSKRMNSSHSFANRMPASSLTHK